MNQSQDKPSGDTIGRNIRRWRHFREMKGEVLAANIGLTKASVSNIENGKTNASLKKLNAIAQALDITVVQLLYSDPQSIITAPSDSHPNRRHHGAPDITVDRFQLEDLRRQLKLKEE